MDVQGPQEYGLSPPPRRVPPTLSVRVVLGGFMTQFGWFFVGFGLIFVWTFDAGAGVVEVVRFSGNLATASGASTGYRALNLSINDVRVFETTYAFALDDGRTFSGASYETGDFVPEGEPVVVEYRRSEPSISRIQGMRASAAGLMIAFVFVFPVLGMVFAVSGMAKGLKARRLMSTGQLALGTLKAKEPTNTRINEQTVYRLTFEFAAAGGGAYEVTTKTHLPYKLEDEAQERLVYDPRNPLDASMLDDLPCRPEIDGRGDFQVRDARESLRALLNLAVPALTILGHGAYLLFSR